jgi:hypothetical protein
LQPDDDDHATNKRPLELPDTALKQPPSEFAINVGAIRTLSGQALVDEEIKLLEQLKSVNARIEVDNIQIGKFEKKTAAHEAQTAVFARMDISKKDKKMISRNQAKLEKLVRRAQRVSKEMEKIVANKETGDDKEMEGGNNMI